MIVSPERKVVDEKDQNLFLVKVVDHLWFNYFYWRFVIGWEMERILVGYLYEEHQNREDHIFPEISWRVEFLQILVFSVISQNQNLIDKTDKVYHLNLKYLIEYHRNYGLDHHQK